ncbi:TIGR03862 family flavoprotein [Aestuariirhabdus litorea]|uniref:TIGR03862 family flavoprotein n=1 Tax=Aestuariirhabdus litorea TaxID=2528527 RepID=UPI001FB43015|nr:TIGR03862 family flavoprotein [Aestuariirhabdus litorea]
MQHARSVVVVGAGPAGLMAAEVIRAAGYRVQVFDAKPSACRKFLLAGIGGMNITHSEPYPQFIQRYYEKADWLDRALRRFDADALRGWVHELGIETFVGSSGRVFPRDMKAAPLLRSWLRRLREAGVEFHMKHRLLDLDQHQLEFEHEGKRRVVEADAVVLALGGGSWPKLGSDGAWQAFLARAGVEIEPLQSANCGLLCSWSPRLKEQHGGSPLKNIAFQFTPQGGQPVSREGECILSHYGMEGSLIYAFSKHLRDAINRDGRAELLIDLLPSQSEAQLLTRLQRKKPKESFAKYLKRSVGLQGVKAALLYECVEREQLQDPRHLAAAIKALPVTFDGVCPIEEAISSAGGVCETSLDPQLMLNALPGVFCAGEMLDWEAPTGGYLLTACFATGRLAGEGVCQFLQP